jgi:hypothetical protein
MGEVYDIVIVLARSGFHCLESLMSANGKYETKADFPETTTLRSFGP